MLWARAEEGNQLGGYSKNPDETSGFRSSLGVATFSLQPTEKATSLLRPVRQVRSQSRLLLPKFGETGKQIH